MVGQKIAQLEARKRAAVEKEDYDTAKAIKVDIDKLRAAGEGAAMPLGGGGVRSSGSKNPDDIFNRVLGKKPSTAGQGGGGGGGAAMLQLPFDEQPVGGRGSASGAGRPGSGVGSYGAPGGSQPASPVVAGPTSTCVLWGGGLVPWSAVWGGLLPLHCRTADTHGAT